MKFYRDLFEVSLNRVIPEHDKKRFFEAFWDTFIHMSPETEQHFTRHPGTEGQQMIYKSFFAMLAGWFVTETGRQPWTVYGVLRTAHSVSPVAPSLVLTSFFAILIVYLLIFAIGLWFLLRLLGRPPSHNEREPNAEVAEQTGRGITPQSIRGGYDA